MNIMHLFALQLYCGKRSEMGRTIQQLRKIYYPAKLKAIQEIEKLTGEVPVPAVTVETESNELPQIKGIL